MPGTESAAIISQSPLRQAISRIHLRPKRSGSSTLATLVSCLMVYSIGGFAIIHLRLSVRWFMFISTLYLALMY